MGNNNTDKSAVLIIDRASALERVADEGMRQWFDWQPGVLYPYGHLESEGPFYFGGLARDQDRFVLVKASVYNSYRRRILCELIQNTLGDVNASVVEARVDQAEREFAEDYSPRPHPAFDADARARQVEYWLSQIA